MVDGVSPVEGLRASFCDWGLTSPMVVGMVTGMETTETQTSQKRLPRYHVTIRGRGRDCATMDEVNELLCVDTGWEDVGESALILDRHTGKTEVVY